MAKEISGLAKETTDCYSLWIRGRTVGEISVVTGLSLSQVELRITRARMSKAELSDEDQLTDVKAILDETIRQAQELLKFPEDLSGREVALLEFITDTAMKKAELYGLVTGGSAAVPDFKEEG